MDHSTLIAGRYRLMEPIGQGGMGRVWKAHDDVLGRIVALKEIVSPTNLNATERQDMRSRSMREARALARLNHPHVVQIFDVVGVENGDPWIVMQYVTGRSLQEAVDRDGVMSPATATKIGLDVLDALQAAHTAGVIHRDVKPANVLLSEDGQVLLTDFGLAIVPGDPSVTRDGQVIGSPAFMAPERARDGTASAASDLWSLGAMLYLLVEGQAPYGRPTVLATLTALVTDPVPRPRQAGSLTPVLKGLLRKDPAARMSGPDAARLLQGHHRRRLFPRHRTAPVAGLADTIGSDPVSEAALAGAPPADRQPMAAKEPTAHKPSPARPLVPVDFEAHSSRPLPPVTYRARSRRVLLSTAGGVLVVAGVLASFALSPMMHGGHPHSGSDPSQQAAIPKPAADPSTSAGATQASSPAPASAITSVSIAPPAHTTSSPRPAASASAFQLPSGWQMRDDGTGFSIPVPDGWEFGHDSDGRPLWRNPAHTVLLLIDQSRQPKSDPVQDWLNNEAARRNGYQHYHRIKIVAVKYWDKAADWEFTYTLNGAGLHVLNRGFVTASDQAYSIYWSTPASQWSTDETELNLILRGFRPART